MLAEASTYGCSDEAKWIAKYVGEQNRSLRRSEALGNESVLNELEAVWSECRHPNWDGYGALPVSQAAWSYTRRLLNSLPLGFPAPSIGVDPDGELTLEWHRSSRRTLSVSVSEDGYLHYAALIGTYRRCGTVPFFDELPQDLSDEIERVCGT